MSRLREKQNINPCCLCMATLPVLYIVDNNKCVAQQYKIDSLLSLHGNKGCSKQLHVTLYIYISYLIFTPCPCHNDLFPLAPIPTYSYPSSSCWAVAQLPLFTQPPLSMLSLFSCVLWRPFSWSLIPYLFLPHSFHPTATHFYYILFRFIYFISYLYLFGSMNFFFYYFCRHTFYFYPCSFSFTNIYLCISPPSSALFNCHYVMPPAILACHQPNLFSPSPYQTTVFPPHFQLTFYCEDRGSFSLRNCMLSHPRRQ